MCMIIPEVNRVLVLKTPVTTDGTANTARTSSDLSRITGYSSLQPMETDCLEKDSRFLDRALGLSRSLEKTSNDVIDYRGQCE